MNRHRMTPNRSISASGATVIASFAMATAIRISPTASSIYRARLLESVPFAEGYSTSLKWIGRERLRHGNAQS